MALVAAVLAVIALLLAILHHVEPSLVLVCVVLMLIAGGPYIDRRA